jgi:N12 class adenine-specific DNA methylase
MDAWGEPTGEIGLARRGVAALELATALPDTEDGSGLSDGQRETLAGWTGWGPLAKALGYQEHQPWSDLYSRVEKVLDYHARETARNACDTAFYTPAGVARAIWDLVTGLGFDGGRVLEPGCGSGRFMTAAPPGLDVEWTGVEADKVSAYIAGLLHPDAKIVHGRLEKTALRYGGFDLAVGNVPFSQQGVYDPNLPKGITSLHGYFLWRALQAVRPGGLAVFVTSRWTLDSVKTEERDELAKLAIFLGAIRLPDTALAPGGTRAVTDIIVFQRHAAGQPLDQGWQQPATQPAALDTTLSLYFQTHPGMVCGTLANRHGQRQGMTLAVELDPALLPAELDARVQQLIGEAAAAGLGYQPRTGPPPGPDPELGDPMSERAFTLHQDGSITQQRDGRPVTVRADLELAALIRLRDAVVPLFAAEADETISPNVRERIRQAAYRAYQEYTAAYGWVSRGELEPRPDPDGEPGETYLARVYSAARRAFREDPDWPTVLAVEVWDDDARTGTAAPILLRHVAARTRRKTSTDDPGEALLLCLDETGQVDLDVIARYLSCDPEAVPVLLEGEIWRDPDSMCWVPTDEYLSGNVRVKLTQARDAGEGWEANVAALEAVQPEDLGPEDISIQLGAPWVPTEIIGRFIAHILNFDWDRDYQGRHVDVRYEPLTATWDIKGSTQARRQPAATAKWGTTRVNAINLVEDACNGTSPVVHDMIDKVQVKNREETALAADRIRDLQEYFAQWAWEDPKRAEVLGRIYNDRFNSMKVRTFDGSFLTFPGMVWDRTPYPHQTAMVLRNICTPTTLCGHVVGAGKTWSAVASVMKLRQMGLIRKGCMVVPNHLLDQTCAEARRYYPGMQVLMVTKEDLNPDRRKYFAAKVAARDWDLVVMTIQQFGSLNVSPDIQSEYYSALLDELDVAMETPAAEESRSTAKMLARKRKKLIARLDALADRPRDGGVTFEQTGIDYLVVDEAHWAKNLEFTARAEGFNSTGSKRADDLMMKLTWLRGKNPDGRCGMLMTGTPVSNALSELHILFRYCAPHLLAEQGIVSFDSFAAQYIRYQTQTEVDPGGGGFRSYRRPRLFVNLPELRSLLWQFADIRGRDQLQIDGPEVLLEQVVVEPPPEMAPFIATLVARADKIRGGGVHPKEDNMLLVCGDGRKAALWLAMAGIDTDAPGKIERCAADTAAFYHQTRQHVYDDPDGFALFDDRPGALQVIFCDQGTPDSWDYGVYHRLTDLLVEAGVPRKRIAWIHDAKRSHEARAALFARCRAGEISVLIGSTEMMGTGVNIQRRLRCIRHLDAPWRPADIEQRDGRGDRPGNGNDKLFVYRYATKGSFDAYMWQALERKARFIRQVLTGDPHIREAEVADNPQVLSYGELKALATGQPLLLMLSEVNSEVARLRNNAAGHRRAQIRMQMDHTDYERRARELAEEAKQLRRIDRNVRDAGDERTLEASGQIGAGAEEAAQEVTDLLTAARQYRRKDTSFRWRGVAVTVLLTYPKKGAPYLAARIASDRWQSTGHTVQLRGHVWAAAGGGATVLEQVDAELDKAAEVAAERDDLRKVLISRAADLAPYLEKEWDGKAQLAAALKRRGELEHEIDAQVKDSRPKPAPVPQPV